jgi:hypothetical protein
VLAGGALGLAVEATWFVVNRDASAGLFGSHSHESGLRDGIVMMTARATRYAVETVELPGAAGRDAFLYIVPATLILLVGILTRRPRLGLVAAALAALPVTMVALERGLRRVYFNGWQLVGSDSETELGVTRDPSVASNLVSWFGPIGLALTIVALVVVTRSAAHGRLRWTAVACAAAPVVLLLEAAVASVYNPFTGRFVMAGVALAAATWGVVRSFTAGAIAVVAVAATTVLLSLVSYAEKPAGIDLLEDSESTSIWTLPREWAQSLQPEVARVIGYVDDHAARGTTIAVSRDHAVYPFAHVGYPSIEHRIAYADTLSEATRRKADWAVLSLTARCEPGWRLELRSPPWGVYRQVAASVCR